MKRKANMKYLLGLYYVSSTSMQINTAELQKTFCYELSPNRGPQGDVEKSDDLLEMTPLRGRAHTCESGARSRDLSSVPPTGRSSPHKEEEALTQMTPFPLMLVTA